MPRKKKTVQEANIPEIKSELASKIDALETELEQVTSGTSTEKNQPEKKLTVKKSTKGKKKLTVTDEEDKEIVSTEISAARKLFVEKLLENDFEQDNLYLPSVKFNQNYPEFLNNELLLNREISIKTLSENVQNKMKNIDFCFEKERRIHLFKQYEKIFQADNEIFLMLSDGEVPYCYPFCTSKTIYNKIFNENGIILLKLWKNYPKNFEEYYLNNTAVIPLDDDDLAKKIISVLG